MCQEIAGGINTEMREHPFKGVLNFRDLGGYRAKDGRIVEWQLVYRSGELQRMTQRDLYRMKREVRPASLIDLRSDGQAAINGVGRSDELGARYFHIPFTLRTKEKTSTEVLRQFHNSGDEFLYRLSQEDYGRKIVEVLHVLADPENLPCIFHCNAGKSRTGIIAMMILGALGVADDDIIADYMLSARHMEEFLNRWSADPNTAATIMEVPSYMWIVEPDSMYRFLNVLRERYGSFRDYLKLRGADDALFERLETTLLTQPTGPSAASGE